MVFSNLWHKKTCCVPDHEFARKTIPVIDEGVIRNITYAEQTPYSYEMLMLSTTSTTPVVKTAMSMASLFMA